MKGRPLGVKKAGGQAVHPWQYHLRHAHQYYPGANVGMGRSTPFALTEGKVEFSRKKNDRM